MLTITDLPHVNASLNGITVILLLAGFRFIHSGRRDWHRAAMISALVVSCAFLISYLVYHFNAGLAKFGGEGIIRPIYFGILIAHVIAAVIVTPLVLLVVWRAFRGQFDRHRALARWTWPLWMYVAVSGVIVYVMSIHMFPDPLGPYAYG